MKISFTTLVFWLSAAAAVADVAARPTSRKVESRWAFGIRYGRYCGAGTTNMNAMPIDELDNCCRYHDLCFTGGHCDCSMADCNQSLVDCVKDVKAYSCRGSKSKMCKFTDNVIFYANAEVSCAGECSSYDAGDYY